MASETLRHGSIAPNHPGELLREVVIPATGRSKTEIAKLLGISRQTLYDVLGEKQPVTPALAVRLGKLFGDGAGVWLRMQAATIPGTLNARWRKRSRKFRRSLPPDIVGR